MTDKLQKKPATRRDREDARRLQAAGTHGDTVLAHISPRERDLLDMLSDGLLDGGGRNPTTGLLSFDESDRSDNSNTSNAGENTGGMDGTPGSGVSEGPGANNGYGSNDGGYSGYGGYSTPNSLGYAAYDPATMPSIESLLNTPSGFRAPGYDDLSMMQYSPPDTFGRLVDTYRYGPPPSYKALGAVPGRYGAPNARGPGVVGTAVANFGGPAMSAAMNLGMHMDQAMSPESRAASLAENQAIGAQNSTGQDRDSSTGLSFAELDARNVPGAASGSNTAGLLGEQMGVGGTGAGTTAPGMPTVQPGGLMATDERERTLTGLPLPVQNLLADYIWRGRQGGGFGW